jgi:hypothetical protein
MGETREALLSFESKHGLCAESILQGASFPGPEKRVRRNLGAPKNGDARSIPILVNHIIRSEKLEGRGAQL